MHHKTTQVLVMNISNQPLYILHCQKLGYVLDIYYNNYFLANAKSSLNSVTFSPKTLQFFEYESFYIPISTNPFIETRLDNGVKVY